MKKQKIIIYTQSGLCYTIICNRIIMMFLMKTQKKIPTIDNIIYLAGELGDVFLIHSET